MKLTTTNKNDIITDVINIYNKYNIISKTFYYKKGKYSLKCIEELFGNFINLINEINSNNIKINYEIVSRKDLEMDIIKIYNKYKKINYILYRNEGKYNPNFIIDIFGSFNKMKNELNIREKKYVEKTKDEILKLGLDYFNENNSLKKMEFLKEKNISYTDFSNKFSSYDEFLELLDLKQDIKKIDSNKISKKLLGNNNSKKQLNLAKNEIEKIILEVYNNKGSNNFTAKYLYENSILYESIIKKYYKTFSNMKHELNLYNNKEYFMKHKKKLNEYLISLYNDNGKLTREIIKKYSIYPYKMIISIYGSHENMLNELCIKKETTQYKNITIKELLQDIQDLYLQHHDLSKEIIQKFGKYNYRMYYTKIGNIQEMFNTLNMIKYNKNSTISSIGIYSISIISILLHDNPEIEKQFDWLINPDTGYNLKLDAYFPKYKLAIEYDGIQHYEYTPAFDETYNKFLNRQKRDKLKEKLCKENGIKLIRIKYNISLNKENLTKLLMENNITF